MIPVAGSSPLIALTKIGSFDLLMLSNPQMTDRSRLVQRVNVVLLVLNALGAFGYVARASLSWAVAVLPILAVFLLLNLTWGALILGYRQMAKQSLVVAGSADLARRNCDRFRASLNPKRPQQSTPCATDCIRPDQHRARIRDTAIRCLRVSLNGTGGSRPHCASTTRPGPGSGAAAVAILTRATTPNAAR